MKNSNLFKQAKTEQQITLVESNMKSPQNRCLYNQTFPLVFSGFAVRGILTEGDEGSLYLTSFGKEVEFLFTVVAFTKLGPNQYFVLLKHLEIRFSRHKKILRFKTDRNLGTGTIFVFNT